jgi:hypothetical protein
MGNFVRAAEKPKTGGLRVLGENRLAQEEPSEENEENGPGTAGGNEKKSLLAKIDAVQNPRNESGRVVPVKIKQHPLRADKKNFSQTISGRETQPFSETRSSGTSQRRQKKSLLGAAPVQPEQAQRGCCLGYPRRRIEKSGRPKRRTDKNEPESTSEQKNSDLEEARNKMQD